MKRWMLSQFYLGENGWLQPVAAAYSQGCRWPLAPEAENEWALVECYVSPQQIEAAQQDPRIVVCPQVYDPAPLPASVIQAYADKGAIAGMSLGMLLSLLGTIEPLFAEGF